MLILELMVIVCLRKVRQKSFLYILAELTFCLYFIPTGQCYAQDRQDLTIR